MRVAVIGSGISGLVSAYLLSNDHEVVLYESEPRLGGHTNTVRVERAEGVFDIDTGFIVFNPDGYPNFVRLLRELGVESQPSTMSFSVRDDESGLEYNGTSLNGLFAQRKNLLSVRFLRMVRDILRFYREARELLQDLSFTVSLGDYLRQNRYSQEFIEWHLLPMGSAIWSTGRSGTLSIPAAFLVQFFERHGFLKVKQRPRWRVLLGGSSSYIAPLTRRFKDSIRLNTPVVGIQRHANFVSVKSAGGASDRFDQVVIATHSDQALRILVDPTPAEQRILGSVPYAANDTVLHTDETLLPSRRLARASWNCHLPMALENRPSVTYYMNSLQGLASSKHFCVTLNRTEKIAPSCIIRKFNYDHPVFTQEALLAQRRRSEISGVNRTFYSGAYWGYGFHEDGVNSALEVGSHFGRRLGQ